MELPLMTFIRQQFNVAAVEDVEAETRSTLHRSGALEPVKAGDTVAIAVGSRGIVSQEPIVKTLCAELIQRGARPFIFPAMGSHGGATSEGQRQVLHSLGITEESMGVKVLSEAQGVLVGETSEGIPLYTDKNARQADHIIVVNRVKPHTKFKGPVESGIAKMLTIGMGKVQGAETLHNRAVAFGLDKVIVSAAETIVPLIPFRFGLAILETPDKKIHSLSVIFPDRLIADETVLLTRAAEIMPRIPVDRIDLLIVDRIGKDISGTGMDTNVIGRNRDILGDFFTRPHVRRILVRDLTQRTQGNANGIGFADFTTRRLKDKIDIQKTYKNALTAMSPEKAAIPVYLENDREAVETALRSIGLVTGKEARIVRIKNTSDLGCMQVSQAFFPLPETVQPESEPQPMQFNSHGNLEDIK